MNTIDSATANQMEIMQAFRITRDLTKKIDTVRPTNQSELLAITGFPSNYFDDTGHLLGTKVLSRDHERTGGLQSC